MFFSFLKTKIGLSLILAVLIILTSVGMKLKNSQNGTSVGTQVALIADAGIKNALKNGDGIDPTWEETLKLIAGTSTDSSKIALLQATSSGEQKTLTATDRFAQTFFTDYIALKKSGALVDENTGTDLVNKLLVQDYGSAPEEKTYTESDIKILNSSSRETLKTYGNAFGAIVSTPFPKGYEHELVIVVRVNDTENTEDLKKLDQNIARYRSIRDRLVALPVPNSLVRQHLGFINSLSAMLEGVRGMALMETDPVGATKMIARYQDNLAALSLPALEMKAYFKKQNVVFSSLESGYLLTK